MLSVLEDTSAIVSTARHLAVQAADSWFNQPEACKPGGDSYYLPTCLDNRYNDVANNNEANLEYIMN